MINSKMRAYDYFLLGQDNGYGQLVVIQDENNNPIKQGEVNLSISTISQSVADDIRYSDSSYIGLTLDRNINDKYLIKYNNCLLKVLYVNTEGRYTQVYLSVYEYRD